MWGILALLALQAAPVAADPICDGTLLGRGSAGVLDVRLGEPFAAAMARSTYRFHSDLPPSTLHFTPDRLDLRFRDGTRLLDRPGIGGMPNAVLQVTEEPDGSAIGMLGFNDQSRPLALAEALDRALALRRWFAAGGFRPLPVLHGVRDSRGFPVTSAPHNLARPRDRAAAQAMLADEGSAIAAMNLFRLRRGRQQVDVTLENWRRITIVTTGRRTGLFDGCNGREWGLHVYLTN